MHSITSLLSLHAFHHANLLPQGGGALSAGLWSSSRIGDADNLFHSVTRAYESRILSVDLYHRLIAMLENGETAAVEAEMKLLHGEHKIQGADNGRSGVEHGGEARAPKRYLSVIAKLSVLQHWHY